MASLKDWITFPKENDVEVWTRWGLRGNAWLNTLKACVSAIDARLTTAESDITTAQADITELTPTDWTTYTPTRTNWAASTVSSARYQILHNTKTGAKQGSVYMYLTATGAATGGTITISLPFTLATHYRNRTGWGTAHMFDVGGTPTIIPGVIKVETAGDAITIRRESDAAFWAAAVPVTMVSGDVVAIEMSGLEVV